MTTTPATKPTPDAILDVAERLFADRGFERTTAQAIGRAAGASPGLIYYYFGSKAGLYRAVLERSVGGLAQRGLAAIPPDADPEEAIRAIVRVQAEVLLARPHIGRLVIRELVDHQASHAEPVLREGLANLFTRVTDLIRAGQEAGRFRPGFDPRFSALSTIAQVAWVVTASPAIGILLGHGPSGPPGEVRAAYATHAAEFALAALRLEETPA